MQPALRQEVGPEGADLQNRALAGGANFVQPRSTPNANGKLNMPAKVDSVTRPAT
jgi:hypothetical protein